MDKLDGMSMNISSEKTLSREQFFAYLEEVREKIMDYIDSLTDDQLYEIPIGCI